MRRMPIFAFVLFMLAPQSDPCDAMTQAQMNRCAHEDYIKADHALNSVYGVLMNTLEEPRKAKLKASERAWIAFRDAQCEFEASAFEGGTMQPMVFSACMADVTRARAKQLGKELEQH